MPLSLSRKPGQTIRIGDNVRIVIRSTSRGRVVLAIDAPPEVRVLRGERDQDQPRAGDDHQEVER